MEISHGYKAEIPPMIIFEKMKNYSYDFYQKNKALKKYLITKDYLNIRLSIINLIRRISDRLGFKSQTFFLSIHYFDIVKLESNEASLFNNFNSLALSCLVIASKFCENDPNVPQLPYFIRVYNSIVENKNRNSIAISDLIYNEVKICKILNYRLQYYTIYDYNSFLFGHGILKLEQLKEIKIDNNISFSLFAKKILEKIYKKSRIYLDRIINKKESFKYNSLLMSIYIMQKSVENVIINEYKIYNDIEKIKIKKQSHKYFKEIMDEFYKINYESMEEYQLMNKELEPHKYRNNNIIENINNSLCFNNHIIKDLSLVKINTDNSDFFRNSINCINYIKENKMMTEENKSIIKLKEDNIKDKKLFFQSKENKDLYYSLNYINKKNNNNFDFKRKKIINLGNKKTYSLNKYSNIQSLDNSKNENNILYYNNYTSNLASSINFNNLNDKHIFNNEINNIMKSKSISPNNNDNKNKKIDNSKIIKVKENKINTKDFNNNNISANINLKTEKIEHFNEDKLNNINKLYYKKILYNNGEKKKKSNSINNKFKKNNILNSYNNINSDKKFINQNIDIVNIKNKDDKNDANMDNRNINFFSSFNNSDNEKENNNKNIDVNKIINRIKYNYFSIKNRINKKNKNIKNTSYNKKNKLNILSQSIYPLLKFESLNNTENNYLDSYIGKIKQILKKKNSNINIYRDNNDYLNNRKEFFTKTEMNDNFISTSIKLKRLKRPKSKELDKNKNKASLKGKTSIMNKKYSNTKINVLKNDNNYNKTIDNRFQNQEYNIITLLGEDINNNINLNSYNSNYDKKSNNNNIEKRNNKNKLIINNNINNNFNKFDNEIFSFSYKSNLSKKLSSKVKEDIINNKKNYKECKEFTIDEHINKNSNDDKYYSLTSSTNYQNQKELDKNNIIINKHLFHTIVINNNININLNKEQKSKNNIKKLKLGNNTLNNFFRNDKENKIFKKISINHKTTEQINNKKLKIIKNQ